MINTRCLIYLDDIIVFGTSAEEHNHNLSLVLTRLQEAGLKIKPSKCKLMCKSVKYLGHIISAQGILPDPAKVDKVQKWPTPSNTRDVQCFLGFAGYYRRFVDSYAHKAHAFYALTRKSTKFKWTDTEQHAFDSLKQALTYAPLLPYPNFNAPFILDTDASTTGLGAVLSQVDGQGRERPIAFASRSTSNAEKSYTTTRLEMLAIIWASMHFRPYLLHAPFTLRTDHAPLKWLLSFKSPTGQVARWIERLAEYNFQIIHRNGKTHTNADALSRMPQPEEKPVQSSDAVFSFSLLNNDFQEFSEASAADAEICLVKRRLNVNKGFLPGDSRAIRKMLESPQLLNFESNVLYSIKDGKRKAIVPKSLRSKVMQEAHATNTTGHLASERTLARIKEHFYWPNMYMDVFNFCKSCTTCQQAKGKTCTQRAPLSHITAGAPFEIVAMDIMGPLTTTNAGKSYILVVIDYYTKWIEIFALSNIQARTVATCIFNNVIARYGTPEQIHTDQGSQFESLLFKELCTLLQIHKSRTTPYHPAGDGLVERSNRTIQNILKTSINNNYKDWDLHLPATMLAYNTSVHSTTGYTPHYLMFGREARIPLHAMYPLPQGHTDIPITQFIDTIQNRLHEAYTTVRYRTEESHRYAKQLYDR